MNSFISRITFTLLALSVSQQTVFAQEFISSPRSASFDNFTMGLESAGSNLSRMYDDRTSAAARNHWVHTSASNMTNLMQSDQSYNQSATSQIISNNSTNQGPNNQGNNQGNNGFFGGGFPGGVGLPLFGGGFNGGLGGFGSTSLFNQPGFAGGNALGARSVGNSALSQTRGMGF